MPSSACSAWAISQASVTVISSASVTMRVFAQRRVAQQPGGGLRMAVQRALGGGANQPDGRPQHG